MIKKSLTLCAATFFALSSAALAADVLPRFEASALSFSGARDFTNGRLQITGPNDFEAEETAKRGLPVFRIQGGRMRDGFYHFHATAATSERVKIKKPVDNGRGPDARNYTLKPFSISGIFQVDKGRILPVAETAGGADNDSAEN